MTQKQTPNFTISPSGLVSFLFDNPTDEGSHSAAIVVLFCADEGAARAVRVVHTVHHDVCVRLHP